MQEMGDLKGELLPFHSLRKEITFHIRNVSPSFCQALDYRINKNFIRELSAIVLLEH
jgi:hypothetical protein